MKQKSEINNLALGSGIRDNDQSNAIDNLEKKMQTLE